MLDYMLEAEYADGYVHRQDEQDHSPYASGKNIFSDILYGRPVEPHGKMVRLSLVGPENTHNVDWSVLPDNARPIYLRHMSVDQVDGVLGQPHCNKYEFGYQYNDEDGRNHKEVTEIF